MSHVVPSQNPAVVLRSHYRHLQRMLVVALIAIVGLSTAVVVTASDSDPVDDTGSPAPAGQIHYGGFSPNTGRPESAPVAKQPQTSSAPVESQNGPGFRTD